jgi:hypothetical protein
LSETLSFSNSLVETLDKTTTFNLLSIVGLRADGTRVSTKIKRAECKKKTKPQIKSFSELK